MRHTKETAETIETKTTDTETGTETETTEVIRATNAEEDPYGGMIGGFRCEWACDPVDSWGCVADLLNLVSRIARVTFRVVGYESRGERLRVRADCAVRGQEVVDEPRELAGRLKEALEGTLGVPVSVYPLRLSADSPDDVFSLRSLYRWDRPGPPRFTMVEGRDFKERENLDALCRYRTEESDAFEAAVVEDDPWDDDDDARHFVGTLRFDKVLEEEVVRAASMMLCQDRGIDVRCVKCTREGDGVVDEVMVEPMRRFGRGCGIELEETARTIERYLGCKAELRVLGHTVATPDDLKLIASNEERGPRFMRPPTDSAGRFMPDGPDGPDDHRSATEIFDDLVGLGDVERRIREAVAFAKARKAMDGKRPVLHMCFTGNPGVGKTTVARAMGRLLYEEGLMDDPDKFVEVDRERLVARYVGWTAKTTKEMIERAKGGILFVDEAYSLDAGTRHDYGPEAVATLVKAMEDEAKDLIVVLAGYTEPMERMVKMNPGLRDRIAFNIEFPDYTTDELMEIGRRMAAAQGYGFTNEALRLLEAHVEALTAHKDEAFANARLMRKIIERAAIRQAATKGEDPIFDEATIASIFSDGDLDAGIKKEQHAGF